MFLHGLMGSAANWRRISNAFLQEFHILALDQRGHGRSFHPPKGYHPRDFADDLRKILDELQWDRVTLVGHSMGGRNALEFAFQFSQRVNVLVMEDIGPDAKAEALTRIERLIEMVPTPFPSRERAKEFFDNEYPEKIAFYPQPKAVSQFLLANIEEKEAGRYDWRFNKEGILMSIREGRNEDRWDRWRNLKMPVLVVRGEQSQDLTREVFQRMHQELPHAEMVEIKHAGHWVHFDQPDAFIQSLKQFFHQTLGSNL